MARTIKRLIIDGMKTEDKDGVRTYYIRANGVGMKVEVPESDIRSHKREEVLKAVNDHFLQSLRYLKHVGDLPSNPDPKKLNFWSQTEWGVACKPKNDVMKEFQRFV